MMAGVHVHRQCHQQMLQLAFEGSSAHQAHTHCLKDILHKHIHSVPVFLSLVCDCDRCAKGAYNDALRPCCDVLNSLGEATVRAALCFILPAVSCPCMDTLLTM